MPAFPPITVRQPQPHDIVDDPVVVCGAGVGFEGAVGAARVRDTNGTALAQVSVHAGGTGIWGNFHVELPLGAVPATPQGALEVFGFHAGTGAELGKLIMAVSIAVVGDTPLGWRLMPALFGLATLPLGAILGWS